MSEAGPGRDRFWLLAVLVATFLVYANSLAGNFVMDDRLLAMGMPDGGVANERVYELQPIQSYFTTSFWAAADEGDVYFRPLTSLSFALRHAVFGDNAFVARLINLLLHMWATALAWLLARRLGVSVLAASAGAAVFGVHAIHTEVVANVSGRSYAMGFAFAATAALLLFRAGDDAIRLRPLRTAGAALLLFCAFSSNEGSIAWIPFLLVLGLAFRWQRENAPIPATAAAKLGGKVLLACAVPAALFLLLRHGMLSALPEVEHRAYVINPLHDAPITTRALTGTSMLGYGVWLTLAPFTLACDYGAEVFTVLRGFDWRFLAGLAVLLAVLVGGLLARRRHPILFVAMAVFLGFAFVTSNIPLPIGTMFGERLYYVPSLGLSLVVAWLIGRTNGTPAARAAWAAVGLWLIASSAMTVHRNGVWRDDRTLFFHDVEVQPRSIRMHDVVAGILAGDGDLDGAMRHLRTALALDPEDAQVWNTLGSLQMERGQLADAERSFQRGLAAQHQHPREDLCNLHGNLGLLLRRQRKFREAAHELTNALKVKPSSYRTWSNLISMIGSKHLTADRLRALLAECERDSPGLPHWAVYRALLDDLTQRYGQVAATLPAALAALKRTPRTVELHSRARFVLAHSLAKVGRGPESGRILAEIARDPYASAAVRQQARRVLGG